jgi:hypothetical protein
MHGFNLGQTYPNQENPHQYKIIPQMPIKQLASKTKTLEKDKFVNSHSSFTNYKYKS